MVSEEIFKANEDAVRKAFVAAMILNLGKLGFATDELSTNKILAESMGYGIVAALKEYELRKHYNRSAL
jgi:hypothetical protein